MEYGVWKRKGGVWKIRTNFREKYKYLCKIYHEKYDEEVCREYYERLKKHGGSKINRALDIAIDSIKFFPTIAEINEIISNMPPEWFYKELKIKNPTEQEQEVIEKIIKELGE